MVSNVSTSLCLRGENAKALTYFRDRWGLSNSDIVRKIFIDYCETKGIYEALKNQTR